MGVNLDSAPIADLSSWNDFLNRYKNPEKTVKIGLIGKYVELKDSYKSIAEALDHAGAELKTGIELDWIHSEQINEANVTEKLGASRRHSSCSWLWFKRN